MKTLTIEDIKVGSIWRNKAAPSYSLKVKMIKGRICQFNWIETPEISYVTKGSLSNYSVDFILQAYELVYIIEGFEI